MAHEEYLRRNLIVCSAYGADAAIREALGRLRMMKSPPKWLMETLLNAKQRAEMLPSELARWRDSAPDAPTPKETARHRHIERMLARGAELELADRKPCSALRNGVCTNGFPVRGSCYGVDGTPVCCDENVCGHLYGHIGGKPHRSKD